MTREMFEMALCRHGTPVLMGWKPSNLISFSKEESSFLAYALEEYSRKLDSEGVQMEVLCSCKRHEMVLVYRPKMLEHYLRQREVRALLEADGYPMEGTLKEMLAFLETRFSRHEEFPHEIGLFLGYPVEDVKGFQQNKGKNCKLCGYWKVYGDPVSARRLFAQFDTGREFLKTQLQKGLGILQAVREANEWFAIPVN